jgi:hypothetical protein
LGRQSLHSELKKISPLKGIFVFLTYICLMVQHNKISLCREIICGLIFLGYNTQDFSELKNKFGGLRELHNFVETKISGHV